MKNGPVTAKFKERPKLKEKSIKIPSYNSETYIYINESLSFDSKKLKCHVRKKSRILGYNIFITDNGLIKVKAINKNGDYKCVKIANRNDLD